MAMVTLLATSVNRGLCWDTPRPDRDLLRGPFCRTTPFSWTCRWCLTARCGAHECRARGAPSKTWLPSVLLLPSLLFAALLADIHTPCVEQNSRWNVLV